MPRDNHAQSITSNGDQREDKKLLQHSQLSQRSEIRHVSVSERQRSHLCSQNLCGAFVRAVLATNFEESNRAMAADGTTKALVAISTTKVSFSTIILILCHCIIAITTV